MSLTLPIHRRQTAALAVTLATLAVTVARADPIPTLDHVVVVVMENKTYDQARVEPFTAYLISQSSSFSRSYSLTHPSEPNYLALWSGSTQGVTDDACPPPGAPYHTANLGHACEAAGIGWKAYCENLPAAGSTVCSYANDLYVRRHCPWTDFANLDHTREVPFTQLAIDESLGTLPRLAFVIPNDCDNTHDCATADGDVWLSNQIPALVGAVGTNGVVIITWDEDDGSGDNQILTIFTGPRVLQGYLSGTRITHYTLLRTLCATLGLTAFGAATTETPIADIWTAPVAGLDPEHEVSLGAPAPNPSGFGVSADLHLPGETSLIEAAIYDVAGRRIARIAHGSCAGPIRLAWDGRDEGGRRPPAGIYVLTVRVNSRSMERRFVLLR